MLPKGAAKKVTIYLNGDTRHRIEPLWSVIFSFLKQKQVTGATVIRPDLGFGSHGQVHDSKSEYAGEHLPIKIEFIETPERVDELLPSLYDMVTDGLVEVQDTTIVKDAAGGSTEAPQSQPARNLLRDFAAGPAKLVRIYLGESDKFDGEPLYREGAAPDVAARRDTWFAPYHAAIEAEIARLRERHPRVVLYDCHSIRSHIRDSGPFKSCGRPDSRVRRTESDSDSASNMALKRSPSTRVSCGPEGSTR